MSRTSTSTSTLTLTPLNLLNISRLFDKSISYKELIHAFKKDFDIKLSKAEARELIESRSWSKVFVRITGENINLTDDADIIRPIEPEKYELLEAMLKCSVEIGKEFDDDINEFVGQNYYINEGVNYFNLPLYGQIITYKRKEPFLKCFLINVNSKGKKTIDKIEDVPVSNDLPRFLLEIVRKINFSPILTTDHGKVLDNPIDYIEDAADRVDIFTTKLFIKYGFKSK